MVGHCWLLLVSNLKAFEPVITSELSPNNYMFLTYIDILLVSKATVVLTIILNYIFQTRNTYFIINISLDAVVASLEDKMFSHRTPMIQMQDQCFCYSFLVLENIKK